MDVFSSLRTPMKSSKSNTIIPVATKDFSLRHPCHDIAATLRSLSEQPFDLTMHYTGHHESTHVTVDVTHSSTTSTYEKLKVKH